MIGDGFCREKIVAEREINANFFVCAKAMMSAIFGCAICFIIDTVVKIYGCT